MRYCKTINVFNNNFNKIKTRARHCNIKTQKWLMTVCMNK